MGRFLLVVSLLLATPALCVAGPVFSDDFEGDLSQWFGKSGGTHSGYITADPNESDHALAFRTLESAGELFTSVDKFAAGDYVLCFDYLGIPGLGGVPGNLGGYVGISTGTPDTHRWLMGTSLAGGSEADDLIDDGKWHRYEISFTAAWDFRIMLEDFSGSGGVAGDALFDNIALNCTVVPLPAPGLLLCLGLGAAFLASRRRFRR
jgi:hypothetical protein